MMKRGLQNPNLELKLNTTSIFNTEIRRNGKDNLIKVLQGIFLAIDLSTIQ
ncbi:unnamed protein product [Paramecium octaurelia]|uniref:Uncharacterized protein n=1 Tax=Paramecium octaurelia TaxID=43137 RepID=A0A8S1YIF5_PAROT|nr:unnamed protein product [Paramecium octaurelia]CAD8211334.1 unnamed protein product [Paramecium octaurelia]